VKRTPILILVGAAIAAMASAGVVLAARANAHDGGGKATGRRAAGSLTGFSVFAKPGDVPDARASAIAADLGATTADLDHFQVLADGLGTFQSRLIAYPAMSGENVCYSLLGPDSTDPGMSYCYRPGDTQAPAGIAGERFSVVALESHAGEHRDVGTQVFGVAEDSVASLRVLVSGAWHSVPINNNGFYLDLPGVPRSEAGTVEATLADGSMQVHDLRTGE
jgi:hypothetical protein